ncbi:MAG: hypothetical protein HZB15_10840 [Actinobacteria bacterium]|nr:hypothetical protein [Actinomycetota bacterium]
MLHLRRAHPDRQIGSFEWVGAAGELGTDVLAYRRGADWLGVLTLGDDGVDLGGVCPDGIDVAAASDLDLVGRTVHHLPGRTAIVGRRAGTMQA